MTRRATTRRCRVGRLALAALVAASPGLAAAWPAIGAGGPVRGDGSGPPPRPRQLAQAQGAPSPGECGFWVGVVRRWSERHGARPSTPEETSVFTTYVVRLWEARAEASAGEIELWSDHGTVWERVNGRTSGPTGSRTLGEGSAELPARHPVGWVRAPEPSATAAYRLSLDAGDRGYPVTVRWFPGPLTSERRRFAPLSVGADPDPERPRTLDPARGVMQGEYAVTRDPAPGLTVVESVTWELSRVSAPCDRPPALPARPPR